MKLYKYMTPSSGKKFLESACLRITPHTCLNDPFEIRLSSQTEKQLNAVDQSLDFDLSTEIQQFMGRHGVISLTETYDNLLMWSHYADEHKGIVVEFDVDIKDPFSLFSTVDAPKSANAKFDKVRYRKRRNYPYTITKSNINDVAEHYYLTKSDEWIYEKEYRFIVPFTMFNKVLVNMKAPKSRDTLLSLGIKSWDEKSDIIDISIEPALLNFEALASVFESSRENGFLFFINVNPKKLSKLFVGVDSCDEELVDPIKNAYHYSPYYCPIERVFYDVDKGRVHNSRFEILFEPFCPQGFISS